MWGCSISTQYIRYPATGSGVTSINSLTGAITLAAGTNITITPAGNTLTIASTASASFPLLAPDGSVSAPSYANSTGKTGIYFGSGEIFNFSTNQVSAGSINDSQLWTIGPTTNANSLLNLSYPVALTSTSPRGLRVGITFPTTATVDAYGIETRISSTAGATYPVLGAIRISDIAVAGTVTRKAGLIVPDVTGGTNNACITDNTAFTGNFFVNQSGTTASVFGGQMTIGSGTSTTHVLNTQLGTNGAAVLTLTNGPAGTLGNPTGYIQININGSNRFIPFW